MSDFAKRLIQAAGIPSQAVYPPRHPRVVDELHFHISNSGFTFRVTDNPEGLSGPCLEIDAQSFGHQMAGVKMATTRAGLRRLGEMLIQAADHPFYGDEYFSTARVVNDYVTALGGYDNLVGSISQAEYLCSVEPGYKNPSIFKRAGDSIHCSVIDETGQIAGDKEVIPAKVILAGEDYQLHSLVNLTPNECLFPIKDISKVHYTIVDTAEA